MLLYISRCKYQRIKAEIPNCCLIHTFHDRLMESQTSLITFSSLSLHYYRCIHKQMSFTDINKKKYKQKFFLFYYALLHLHSVNYINPTNHLLSTETHGPISCLSVEQPDSVYCSWYCTFSLSGFYPHFIPFSYVYFYDITQPNLKTNFTDIK